MDITGILRGIIGIVGLIGIAVLFSNNRGKIDWALVIKGLLFQIILAVVILKVPFVYEVFKIIADFFVKILDFTEAGANFVFGDWPADAWIQDTDFSQNPPAQVPYKLGYMFAFKVLPTIVFYAALSSVLYYLGILQKIIFVFAWVMSKIMRLSGAESIAAAANVFIGQTEAPLIIRPYLDKMTKSEIMCLMTGGMATIAGSVFAAFVGFLGGSDPEMQRFYATHLLTASIVSAPAAIVAAKILFPENDPDNVNRSLEVPKEQIGVNVLDAISKGTTDGLKLAVNVAAMLLVFIAFVAMFNYALSVIGSWTGLNETIVSSTGGRFTGLSLEYVLGLLFAPIAWLLGTPTQDLLLMGQLLGKKTVVNEFVAYIDLGAIKDNPKLAFSEKSILIATYALCGFSNFSSIGIQIGGIGAIAPSQRATLASLGIKSLIGGTIACFLTATIAGILA